MSKEKELVDNVLSELGANVELFYQQKTNEALQLFDVGLQEMAELVDTLFAYKESHESFPLDGGKLTEVLTEAMEALEDRDLILLADVIQYDFIEYVEELSKEME